VTNPSSWSAGDAGTGYPLNAS